jgi:hypothetical protein
MQTWCIPLNFIVMSTDYLILLCMRNYLIIEYGKRIAEVNTKQNWQIKCISFSRDLIGITKLAHPENWRVNVVCCVDNNNSQRRTFCSKLALAHSTESSCYQFFIHQQIPIYQRCGRACNFRPGFIHHGQCIWSSAMRAIHR